MKPLLSSRVRFSRGRVFIVVFVVCIVITQFTTQRPPRLADDRSATRNRHDPAPPTPAATSQPEPTRHSEPPPSTTQAPVSPRADRRHPRFPMGAPVPVPYRLDPATFSAKQRRVVAAVKHAWDGYVRFAWGHDELLPEQESFVDWGKDSSLGGKTGIGLTAIEVMDTLWLMGLYEEFYRVVEYLRNEHTFNVDAEVSLFETTIRVLGGLLSCYELSGEEICLVKAHEIGSLLFLTFGDAHERNLLPSASVNLHTRRISNPPWLGTSQSLSEVTTIQLEFKKLSYFTGDRKFTDAADGVMKTVLRHSHRLKGGLFPIFVSRSDGSPREGAVTLGARGDSFYEYLVKQWVLTNRTDQWLLDAYKAVSNGVAEHLVVKTGPDEAFIAELVSASSLKQEYKMDHLVCFAVGMFQLGKHGDTQQRDEKIARDVARTCFKMYDMNPTKIGPEIVRFRGKDFEMFPSPGAHHYILRPEAIEAMFYNARFFPEEYEYWASRGWAMFEAIEKHCKTKNGWQGLHDVTRIGSGFTAKMESFFLAETLKYAFLIGADSATAPTQLPLTEWVFNTECHPFRILPGAFP